MGEKSGKKDALPWLSPVLGVVVVIALFAVMVVRLLPGDDQRRALPPPEPAFLLPGVVSGPQIPVSRPPGPPSRRPIEVQEASQPGSAGGTSGGGTTGGGTTGGGTTGGGTTGGGTTGGGTTGGGTTGDPEPTPARTGQVPPPAPVITPPRTGTTTTAPPPGVSGDYRTVDSYSDSFIGEVLVSNDTGAQRNWTVTLSYPGTLRTSWLESLPQPTLVRRGSTYTWTSSVPLAAHSTGALRFQFSLSGAGRPSGCSVNGSLCG